MYFMMATFSVKRNELVKCKSNLVWSFKCSRHSRFLRSVQLAYHSSLSKHCLMWNEAVFVLCTAHARSFKHYLNRKAAIEIPFASDISELSPADQSGGQAASRVPLTASRTNIHTRHRIFFFIQSISLIQGRYSEMKEWGLIKAREIPHLNWDLGFLLIWGRERKSLSREQLTGRAALILCSTTNSSEQHVPLWNTRTVNGF